MIDFNKSVYFASPSQRGAIVRVRAVPQTEPQEQATHPHLPAACQDAVGEY